MNELKKKVLMEFKDFVNDFMEAIDEAEKEGNGQLNLTSLTKNIAPHFAKLDDHFREAQDRHVKNKKGFWG